jgi:hypothetical protein
MTINNDFRGEIVGVHQRLFYMYFIVSEICGNADLIFKLLLQTYISYNIFIGFWMMIIMLFLRF